MENTIAIEEKRSVIEKFRNYYKQKFVETGKAADFEEKLDKKIELQKNVVKVAGSIATVVLIFCPADGPVGEICTALATPLLVKLVELKGELTKKIVLGGKRKLEADFIKADGSSEKIEVPKFTADTVVKDVKDLKDTAIKYSNDIGGKTR